MPVGSGLVIIRHMPCRDGDLARTTHPVDRARLTERAALAPPVHRYRPADDLLGLVRHYWVPVWDLPVGSEVVEQVLQYPTCLVVIASDYARLYGVTTGLSSVTLAGRGWAVGVMLQPGAGPAVFGRGAAGDLADRHENLAGLPHFADTIRRVHQAMDGSPDLADRHTSAIAAVEDALRRAPAPDGDALLLNRVVDLVESDPSLLTVADLARRCGVGERRLQRLTERFLGLSPKWLIQRRRLHEAVHQLKHGTTALARLAADLGYTDQAHFTRDFRRVTGYAPGQFSRTLGRDARAP